MLVWHDWDFFFWINEIDVHGSADESDFESAFSSEMVGEKVCVTMH